MGIIAAAVGFWIGLVIGIGIMSLALMAAGSWIIAGANEVASSCEEDPGYEAAHSRAAWTVSAGVFLTIGAVVVLVISIIVGVAL